MSGALAGRTALITGASQGLGLEIARHYLRAGASGVCICARESAALAAAERELAALAGDGQVVFAQSADVADGADVQRLADSALARFPQLTILVNNAGIYGPKGALEDVEWEAWRRTLEINLFGSVMLARTLAGHFKRRGYGKVIQLSGGGATKPMPGLSAYAASKAAVVRFAETLAEELRPYRIDVNALAPGGLNTRMLDEVLAAGPERVGERYYEQALEQQRSGGDPPSRGAELATWLGSAASDGVSGKLISAVWDPWSELAEHRDELNSDVYTLRRIVPSDRGFDWGER